MQKSTGQAARKQEMVACAASMVPSLKSRALETERRRQLPEETVLELKQAGLVRCVNPERFGGFLDIDGLFDCVMELGRGCGATAWCYSVWTVHNWMVGHWPEQAQLEYFSGGPDVLCSSSFLPLGTITAVEGGYRLSGRWDFSSGCLYSDWCMLGAPTPNGPVLALVPRSDYTIVDTWQVAGLQGTGSNDIVVDDVFVPAYRVAAMQQMGSASPGWELHRRPSYRLPNTAFQAFTLVSPIVGIVQGALDEFVASLKDKHGPGRTADSVALQLRIAESAAEVDAARMIVRQSCREMLDLGAAGGAYDRLAQAKSRRDFSFATRLCLQAVNRLFEAGGGRALRSENPLQRHFRDAHAASHHVAIQWDSVAEAYGRAALGLPAAGRTGSLPAQTLTSSGERGTETA